MNCQNSLDTCESVCTTARKMLIHYSECGKIGEAKARQCCVCSKLLELSDTESVGSARIAHQSLDRPTEAAISEEKDYVSPKLAPSHARKPPMLLPRGQAPGFTALDMEFHRRVKLTTEALVEQEMIGHVQTNKQLRRVAEITRHAKVIVYNEMQQQYAGAATISPYAMGY